jgi:hypothetical protein
MMEENVRVFILEPIHDWYGWFVDEIGDENGDKEEEKQQEKEQFDHGDD